MLGSFIIAVFPDLQPASASQSTVALLLVTQQLGRIAQQLASPASIPFFPNITFPEAFEVPSTTIQVNIFWVLSFVLSLFCALLATLVRHWSHAYLANAQRRGISSSRGPIHAYLRVSVNRFGFNYAVDAIITFLHISVSLFLAGLLVFLFILNGIVAKTAFAAVVALVVFYIVLSLLPLFSHDCPYHTPFTPVFWPFHKVMLAGALWLLRATSPVPLHSYEAVNGRCNPLYHYLLWAGKGRQHILALCSQAKPLARALQRSTYLLQQMLSSLDDTDEIYGFTSFIPSCLAHLQRINHELEERVWLSFPCSCLYPAIDRLLRTCNSGYGTSLALKSYKTEQIALLCLMAIHLSTQK
jgi:hypothetical protein